MNAQVGTRPVAGIGNAMGKLAYRGLILFAIVANAVLLAYVVTTVVPQVLKLETGNRGAVIVPSPSPSATAAVSVMAAIGVTSITNDANCGSCHSAPGETNARPVMAHPLKGWTDCTACHLTSTLVKTAPGHAGLHKDECLICHTARQDQTEPPKPHHSFNGANCTSCHGNPEIPQAPLPKDMADKQNCWVCHTLSDKNLMGFVPAASGAAGTSGGAGAAPLLIGR